MQFRRYVAILLKLLSALFRPKSWRFGATNHYDYVADFLIRGSVVDDAGQPQSDAEVHFRDTGLDYRRSRDPALWDIMLGRSLADGHIDLRLPYMWGRQSTSSVAISGSIQIRLQSFLHREAAFDFETSQLPQKGDEVTVDLGTVTLQRL